MRADLWVIWISMLVLCSTVAFSAGRHMFPSPVALDNAWLDGQEDFVRRNQEADREAWGGREPSTSYAEWLAEGREPEPRWDDTSDHLAQLAAPYYEPLIRGAGADIPPVTTAPCPGVLQAPKGDSPGSGTYPLSFPEVHDVPPAIRFAHEGYWPWGPIHAPGTFPTSPVYDRLAAERAQDARRVTAEGEGRALHGLNHAHEAAGPAGLTLPGLAGPAADPWQEITEQATDVWDVIGDDELFGMLRWEIAAIRKQLDEPFQLTPWKDNR